MFIIILLFPEIIFFKTGIILIVRSEIDIVNKGLLSKCIIFIHIILFVIVFNYTIQLIEITLLNNVYFYIFIFNLYILFDSTL